MRIAAVQTDLVWEDQTANRESLGVRIADAAARGAELVVLPEMFPTGFSMNTAVTVEAPDGPTATWMVAQAAEHDLLVAGSIATDAGEAMPVNRFVVAGADGIVTSYDKLHPFGYGQEADHFQGGNDLVVLEHGDERWALFVCYDLRFANAFWKVAEDVDGYLVVANWPEARSHHWRTLLTARAIENQAWVVAVNRIGSGGGLDYVGDTRVIDPLGEIVADAGDRSETLVVDCDPAVVAEVRARLPFLPDRRSL